MRVFEHGLEIADVAAGIDALLRDRPCIGKHQEPHQRLRLLAEQLACRNALAALLEDLQRYLELTLLQQHAHPRRGGALPVSEVGNLQGRGVGSKTELEAERHPRFRQAHPAALRLEVFHRFAQAVGDIVRQRRSKFSISLNRRR